MTHAEKLHIARCALIRWGTVRLLAAVNNQTSDADYRRMKVWQRELAAFVRHLEATA